MTMLRLAYVSFTLVLVGLLAGCGHHKQARVDVPVPPTIEVERPPVAKVPERSAESKKLPPAKNEPEDATLSVPANTVPLLTETGLASWYGAPYHNRRSSNGELYNMHAMTAPHRTLPLGSIVRVTNVKTGNSCVIEDYRPGSLRRWTHHRRFLCGCQADRYLAAGRSPCETGSPANPSLDRDRRPMGRADWIVWEAEGSASDLVAHLARRYQSAKVDKFLSPVGDWWVRVRVLGDDRQRAEAPAHETEIRQGSVYVVRLD